MLDPVQVGVSLDATGSIRRKGTFGQKRAASLAAGKSYSGAVNCNSVNTDFTDKGRMIADTSRGNYNCFSVVVPPRSFIRLLSGLYP
jgi:hypothetical protein